MNLLQTQINSHRSVQSLPSSFMDNNGITLPVTTRKSFESCRLCLMEIHETNITLLDGIIKDMLEIILPNLNFGISESPSICRACLESLKQSYNFKSSCLEAEDKIQDFVNPKKTKNIDLKRVLRKNGAIFDLPKNQLICRTCLVIRDRKSCTKLYHYHEDPLKNMIEKCLPEVGIELTQNPHICAICLEQLEEQFHFIMQCLDTEEKINYYSEKKNIFKGIDLHEVYLLSTNTEEDVVEEVENQIEHFENEPCNRETNLNNCPEDIKLELKENIDYIDLTEEVSQSTIKTINEEPDGSFKEETHKMKNYKLLNNKLQRPTKEITFEQHSQSTIKKNNEEPDGSFKEAHKMKNYELLDNKPQRPTEEITFELGKDENGQDIITSTTSALPDTECESDVSITKEDELLKMSCIQSISVDNKRNLIKRKLHEKDKFKEDDLDESAEDSDRPKKRLVTRKCTICDFKTKFVSRMKAHMTKNHSVRISSENNEAKKKKPNTRPKPESPKKIKCGQCNFETGDEKTFEIHLESHQRRRRRPKLTKSSPVERALPSRSVAKNFNFSGQFLKMFKCRICPYQTRVRSYFVKHSQSHKITTEIKVHKCEMCNFETIQKENYLNHMQCHKSMTENQMKKCFLCSFQHANEADLKRHVSLVHKSGTG